MVLLEAHKGQPQIWAFGGGKGGVGKSFVCSSFALQLALMGHTTVVVDLDLGSPNIHSCLGIHPQAQTLSDFISGKVNHLKDLMVSTGIPRLRLISGFNDSLNSADLPEAAKLRLMEQLRELDAKYVFLDLSAGTHQTTLDFFAMAHRRLVITTPEPTSIENAYRFIKSGFYRNMKNVEKDLHLSSLIEQAMDQKNQLGIRSPSDLIRHIKNQNPILADQLAKRMNGFRIDLILNQVRTHADVDLGEATATVSRKYFGIPVQLAACLDYDNAVWQSVRKKRPLLLEYPHVPLYAQITAAIHHVMGELKLKSVA